MTGKRLLLFLCGLILIPLLAFAAFLAAGTVIPIGTFNPVERQKLEAKFQEKLKASKFEQRKAQIVTEERRTAQTKGGVAQRKGQSSKSPLNKRLPVSKTKPQFAKQPAVGGGIGPADADVIIGINTAGTVHVNRFAWLEAGLDVVGRGVGILLASIGILNALNAIFCCKATSSGRISVAAAMIVIGATTPVMIQLIFKAALAANLLN